MFILYSQWQLIFVSFFVLAEQQNATAQEQRQRESVCERERVRERERRHYFNSMVLLNFCYFKKKQKKGGIKVGNLIVNQTNGFDKQNAFGAADSLSQKKVYQRGNEVWKCQGDYTIKLPSLTRSALGVVLVKRMTKICWAPDSFPIHPRLLGQGRFKLALGLIT